MVLYKVDYLLLLFKYFCFIILGSIDPDIYNLRKLKTESCSAKRPGRRYSQTTRACSNMR